MINNKWAIQKYFKCLLLYACMWWWNELNVVNNLSWVVYKKPAFADEIFNTESEGLLTWFVFIAVAMAIYVVNCNIITWLKYLALRTNCFFLFFNSSNPGVSCMHSPNIHLSSWLDEYHLLILLIKRTQAVMKAVCNNKRKNSILLQIPGVCIMFDLSRSCNHYWYSGVSVIDISLTRKV